MELRNAFRQETARPASRDQQITMTQPSLSPAADRTPRFDPGVAHPARVYNVWLGGKDGLAADRKAAAEVAACRPEVVVGARANRAFLARAVRYLASQQGVRQFIDIGPGMPAPLATHEVAQAITPESKIVYVDSDPLVLSHAQALLTSSREGACEYVGADLRDPQMIVGETARTLDFTQPAAVILVAVLHFLSDADDPAAVVAALTAPLAPGSFVVISHLTADMAPDQVASGVAAYNALVPAGITARTHRDVTALFGGLPLVAPGVVPVSEWRPEHAPASGASADVYAGMATVRQATVAASYPGRDEIILAAPDGDPLCNSLGCARAGRAALVIATFGTLNDPGAGYHHRAALWRETWGQPVPLCGTCWEQTRQVAVKYRPGLVVIDARPGVSGGRG